MSEVPTSTEPCEHCGEQGCKAEFHPEPNGGLFAMACIGGGLGASVLGLVALPFWLRRFRPPQAPPGHPRHRLHQDRLVTAAASAGLMAIVIVSSVTALAVEHRHEGPGTPWNTSAALPPPADSELEELFDWMVNGSAQQQAVARTQFEEAVLDLDPEEVEALGATLEEVGNAQGWDSPGARILRDALRHSDEPVAAAILAENYEHMESREELVATWRVLARCTNPPALQLVMRKQITRRAVSRLVSLLQPECLPHYVNELIALIDAHETHRAEAYNLLRIGCNLDPRTVRKAGGNAIAQHWMDHPPHGMTIWAVSLAEALTCADDALLDQALASHSEGLHRNVRAKLRIVAFRRGRVDLETLFDEATEDLALRRALNAHYHGNPPWDHAPWDEATPVSPPRDQAR